MHPRYVIVCIRRNLIQTPSVYTAHDLSRARFMATPEMGETCHIYDLQGECSVNPIETHER
jgi:hypothetical protein